MANPVITPNLQQLTNLATITDVGTDLNGGLLNLFQNNFNPGVGSALGDFTIADFTGYSTSAAIVWGTPFFSPDGVPTVAGDMKTFTAANPITTPNVVYGWYVVDSGATKVLAARRFDSPINISSPFQSVNVVPSIPAFFPE